MKKYYFIIIPFLIIGCTKFEYSDETNRQNIDNYETLEEALTGAYAKFAEIFYGKHGVRNSFMLPLIFADDINPGIYFSERRCTNCNPSQLSNVYTSGIGYQTVDMEGNIIYLDYGCKLDQDPNESDNIVDTDVWTDKYMQEINELYIDVCKAIISLNYIILKSGTLDYEDKRVARLIGEAYFMRSYCYYLLTRVYGQVPLITDIDVNYEIPRASFKEIYDQIEADLLNSIELVPENTDIERPSLICANRGSSKALLAEAYLTMGGYPLHDRDKYQLAAHYAKDVIDHADLYGFGLMDDYSVLFYPPEYQFNREMVSAIQYKSVSAYEDFLNGPPTVNSNELGLWSKMGYAKTMFFNNYPESYRKDITYNREQTEIYYDTIAHEWFDLSFSPLQITTCYKCNIRKFRDNNYTELFFEKKEWYPVYILRFAHTLLTYAEASARSGDLNDLSYEAVNRIRRRAHKLPVSVPSEFDLTSGLTAQQFIDSVVWERAWEFTGEAESRWFDIIRLDMYDQLQSLVDPYEADIPDNILRDRYFFRIPVSDVYMNPNLDTK